MAGRALYGTSFVELRKQAFEWLDRHAGDTPESALLLEETDYQRDALAAAWRGEHNPLRLTVSKLTSIGQTAHERFVGPYPDIETLERRRLIEQALAAAETPAGIDSPRQHTESISELFRELEADGIQDTATLQARLANTECADTQQAFLTDVYAKYGRLKPQLAHPDAIARNEKLAAVASTNEPLKEAFPHIDAIVISGLHDPSLVEVNLLARLAETFPMLVLIPTTTPETPTRAVDAGVTGIVEAVRELDFEIQTTTDDADGIGALTAAAQRLYQPGEQPETPPSQLTWHEAPTPDREISHLARRLRDRLATGGVDPDDILVLAPGLLSYRDGLTDTFDAYGIQHTYQVSILLERTYVGQAVLDAVALCERPTATQISQLATNPLVSIPAIDDAAVADCHRRLYTTAIEPFLAELEDSTAAVETLLAHAENVRTASPTELRPAIDALLEYLGVADGIEAFDADAKIDVEYERRAFTQIQEILNSVEDVCDSLAPADPLAEVADALEGVRVTAPRQAADNRIEILGLQDTPMAEFEELYVLGATAQHLSGQRTRPRFFQSIGEDLGLFDPNEYRDRVRHRFGMLVANADRVHITTPETTNNDESLLVSPLVDELSRVTGLEPTTGVAGERRGSREDLQRAMAGAEPERIEPALGTAFENGAVTETFVRNATQNANCAAHRAEDRPTVHDGQLTTAAMANLNDKLDAQPFSHSRMSTYAKCGFKYLLSTGWNFDEEDTIDPGVSPLDVGSLIHTTVEDFYKSIQAKADDDEPVDLTIFYRTELEAEMLDVGLTVVDDAEESFVDTFGEALLYRLFASLGTPATNDYYAPPGSADDPPKGTFALFLDQEVDRASEGHRPKAFEAEFGPETGIALTDGSHIPAHGVIDRIDETADGGVTIFDYKASSIDRTRGRENNARDGLDFQLPTYALGTPSLFSDRPELSPAAVSARYYILNDDPTVNVRRSIAERFDFDYERFLTETIPDRIDNLTGAINAGAFQPAVVGADAAECQYCAFNDVCDVRHHRRYDVIGAIDSTDTQAYVPDGARPADIEALLPGGEPDE